jgi:hypothetical protein
VNRPYITTRRAARDKINNSGERTATLGAGDQSLILSVGPYHKDGQDGALVDLSCAEKDQPLLVTVGLDNVPVLLHRFNHRVGPGPRFLLAGDCVDALARIHQLVDGKEVGGQALSDIMEVLTNMGLLIADPNDNITDDLEPT